MAIIINLTPHTLNVMDAVGNCILTVPASGQLARCRQVTTPAADVEIEGVLIPTGSNQFGEIQGLPDEKEGTLLFVSALVATAAWEQGRNDVVCPLAAVRDEEGRIVGTSGLATNPNP